MKIVVDEIEMDKISKLNNKKSDNISIAQIPSFAKKQNPLNETIEPNKIMDTYGLCHNISYKYIKKQNKTEISNNMSFKNESIKRKFVCIHKKNQEKISACEHVIFENKITKDKFIESYINKTKSELEKNGMELIEIFIILCETCHSKKCYNISYSFTNKRGEFKYYDYHHFQNNDESKVKNDIVTHYYNKIKNAGGTDITINVYFCDEHEEEMTFIEKVCGWLLFG